jgi:hypothetical protein
MMAIIWNKFNKVSGWSCYPWSLSNILQVQGGPMYSYDDSHLDTQDYKAEEHNGKGDQAINTGKFTRCIIGAGHEEEPKMHH